MPAPTEVSYPQINVFFSRIWLDVVIPIYLGTVFGSLFLVIPVIPNVNDIYVYGR
jgi:hypothetical protein